MSSKKTKFTFSSSDDETFQTKKRYFQTNKTTYVELEEKKSLSNFEASEKSFTPNPEEHNTQNVKNIVNQNQNEAEDCFDQQNQSMLDLSDQFLNTSLDDSFTNKKEKKL